MQVIQGIILIIGVVFAQYVSATLPSIKTCDVKPKTMPLEWIVMDDTCMQKMRDQVQEEVTAAMTYMSMGAHFARDTVNRPGFAKMFFESASEEREHAIKIIEYLLMRGGDPKLKELIKTLVPKKDEWVDGLGALSYALQLEANVTKSIRGIIIACEQPNEGNDAFNDYHLVDYLTGDFLEEQYKGQRDLAGKISTLGKMNDLHGALGEFLFDKKLLNGEPM